MKTLGVIPARFASTRFPVKVLALLNGAPMIAHVWKRAKQCCQLDDVLIACDHAEVFNAARAFGAKEVMTDPKHPSGSDRIAEAVKTWMWKSSSISRGTSRWLTRPPLMLWFWL